MPGTFSQIYIQLVFAVKGRENLVGNSWKTELHKYIAGIIKGKDQKPIIVNGMPDHIHIFIGLRPAMAISALTRDIKTTLQILLMITNLLKENLHGKRDMAHFRIHIHTLERCMTIF